jgi:hypothetical protein
MRSQNPSTELPSPGKRQLIPMTAIGSSLSSSILGMLLVVKNEELYGIRNTPQNVLESQDARGANERSFGKKLRKVARNTSYFSRYESCSSCSAQ